MISQISVFSSEWSVKKSRWSEAKWSDDSLYWSFILQSIHSSLWKSHLVENMYLKRHETTKFKKGNRIRIQYEISLTAEWANMPRLQFLSPNEGWPLKFCNSGKNIFCCLQMTPQPETSKWGSPRESTGIPSKCIRFFRIFETISY